MGMTFSKKNGKRYRYYLCAAAAKKGYSHCPVKSVSAGEIEAAVIEQLRLVFRAPERLASILCERNCEKTGEIERLRGERAEIEERIRVLAAAAQAGANGRGTVSDIKDSRAQLDRLSDEIRTLEPHAVTEPAVSAAFQRLEPLWTELFPVEQARIVRLLLERVDLRADSFELRFRSDGLRSLASELTARHEPENESRAG